MASIESTPSTPVSSRTTLEECRTFFFHEAPAFIDTPSPVEEGFAQRGQELLEKAHRLQEALGSSSEEDNPADMFRECIEQRIAQIQARLYPNSISNETAEPSSACAPAERAPECILPPSLHNLEPDILKAFYLSVHGSDHEPAQSDIRSWACEAGNRTQHSSKLEEAIITIAGSQHRALPESIRNTIYGRYHQLAGAPDEWEWGERHANPDDPEHAHIYRHAVADVLRDQGILSPKEPAPAQEAHNAQDKPASDDLVGCLIQ